MDMKKIILIVGALIVALGAAFGVNMMMKDASAEQARAAKAPKPKGPQILVAVKPLSAGTIIREDAFRFQPWPAELIKQAYFIKGKANIATLSGTVVRFPISAGEPVTTGALVHPSDRGFLAAALSPGMRAVTIRVDTEAGVSGFIFPGDRVDVNLTHDVTVQSDYSRNVEASETVVQNIRVLATDQRVVAQDETGKTPVKKYQSVTLEATPEIARRLAVAEAMGSLSLALRPLAETAGELDAAIASGDIKVPASKDAKADKELVTKVATRPVAGAGGLTTDVDVSQASRRAHQASVAYQAQRRAEERARMEEMKREAARYRGGSNNADPKDGPVVRIVRGERETVVSVGSK